MSAHILFQKGPAVLHVFQLKKSFLTYMLSRICYWYFPLLVQRILVDNYIFLQI